MIIDFETRSRADLRKVGAWAYAEHPSTEILCMGWKSLNDTSSGVWVPGKGDVIWKGTLFFTVDDPHPCNLLAFNAEFEQAIWHHIMVKRYGFPELMPDRWECLMARCAARSLPQNLADASLALGLSQEKDMDGHRLMLKMCKPKKDGTWHETPEDLERLYAYCIQDVEAEYELYKTVPPLSATEQRIWVLDQEINQRGIPVDVEACRTVVELCKDHKKKENARLHRLTGGAVSSVDEVGKLTEFVGLPDVTKPTVERALDEGYGDEVQQEALRIRQAVGKSSVAKFTALLDRASSDGRVRGTMRYHRATTGRWGGSGFQPQNLPSRGIPKNTPEILDGLLEDPEWMQCLYGDLFHLASWCVRPCIRASEGKILYDFDFSSIEGRVLAWLAGDPMLDAYADPAVDVYELTAQRIGPDTPRDIGKVLELACGYQGRVGACQRMAEGFGIEKSDAEWDTLVLKWRANRQPTVKFWYDIEAAAIRAVNLPGRVQTVGRIRIKCDDNYLAVRLPSGRCLWYPQSEIRKDQGRSVLTFMGVRKPSDSPKDILEVCARTSKWVRKKTYGGRLVENIVQAVSRDLLVDALYRFDQAGHDIVFHVHDEVVIEGPNYIPMAVLKSIMETAPAWAYGLTISADGWCGERYRK